MARRMIIVPQTREQIRAYWEAEYPAMKGTEALERLVEADRAQQESRMRWCCLIVPDDFPLEEGTETEPVDDDLFGFTKAAN